MGLKVEKLNKMYGEYHAVDNISFSIENPGVFGLLGTNGAGKTTTIRMILGMLKKDGGTATWNGELYDPHTVSTGYLAEERGIYAKALIKDQLMYFGRLKGMDDKSIVKAMDYWLERLEASDYKNKRAEQLSKGNQQKIQFIAALISDPSFLILDEPFSGLDPVNTDLFKEVVKEEIAKGKHIIMSTHQMATAEEFCENLLILNKGKTVLSGNLREIKKSYGRNNLLLKAEGNIDAIIKRYNFKVKSIDADGIYSIGISSEEEAFKLLKEIVDSNIPVIRFELREPTLHEIFIEKVEE